MDNLYELQVSTDGTNWISTGNVELTEDSLYYAHMKDKIEKKEVYMKVNRVPADAVCDATNA
jgi:hypothetical protein